MGQNLSLLSTTNRGNGKPFSIAISGSLGGVVEACCLQPINVIKTRLQLDRIGTYKGIGHCGSTVIRNRGRFLSGFGAGVLEALAIFTPVERVACLLRKVVREIERRISTQAEHLRTQNNIFKTREEKYQSRIKVLEALASGSGEEYCLRKFTNVLSSNDLTFSPRWLHNNFDK